MCSESEDMGSVLGVPAGHMLSSGPCSCPRGFWAEGKQYIVIACCLLGCKGNNITLLYFLLS